MDKKLILAVAGSGKTTTIINNLSKDKKAIIVTFTNNNFDNLTNKIIEKFGAIPDNIKIYTYFTFLYRFCYKPFCADEYRDSGMLFSNKKEHKPNEYAKKDECWYYFTKSRMIYSNRLSFLLETQNYIEKIKNRIEKFCDLLAIDEVQDFSARDFNFLLKIIQSNVDILLVGDFYQHTYDTSNDGNVNKNLYVDYKNYLKNFKNAGIEIDNSLLLSSHRCSIQICSFVEEYLGIEIKSDSSITESEVIFLEDKEVCDKIISNKSIPKLVLQNAKKHKGNYYNWGETKGMDNFEDVCILASNNIYKKIKNKQFIVDKTITKNKLYVAITRARKNVYIMIED